MDGQRIIYLDNGTMPNLSPKRERFCQEYVTDVTNQAAAAVRAGYSAKTAAQQASRLLKNVNVKEHIAELQQEAGKRCEVTVDSVIANLAELRDEARAKGQYSAAVRAEELIGKTIAAFTDVRRDDSHRMSDEALAGLLKGFLGEDAAAPLLQKLRDSSPDVGTVH